MVCLTLAFFTSLLPFASSSVDGGWDAIKPNCGESIFLTRSLSRSSKLGQKAIHWEIKQNTGQKQPKISKFLLLCVEGTRCFRYPGGRRCNWSCTACALSRKFKAAPSKFQRSPQRSHRVTEMRVSPGWYPRSRNYFLFGVYSSLSLLYPFGRFWTS